MVVNYKYILFYYRIKLEERIQKLTLVLTKELQVSPDKSHKGGLRAARRAVRILNQLDKSSQVLNYKKKYIFIDYSFILL